ncbi:hypothetical protein OESDEN_17776, partial [Oesophagostomum dentatum]
MMKRRRDLPVHCRCFITQMGYRQQRSEPCLACRRKLAKSKSAHSSSQSSFEREEKRDTAFTGEEKKAKSEPKPVVKTPHVEEIIEDKPKRHSRLYSSSSSSDSDFEALSYENFRDEYEKEKVTASAPQLPTVEKTNETATPLPTAPEVPDNSVKIADSFSFSQLSCVDIVILHITVGKTQKKCWG